MLLLIITYKYQYKKSFRDSGYTNFELNFNKTSTTQTKRHWQRNIIWFNRPFSRAVYTIVGKNFLQLLHPHFPPSKTFQIFNKNTVKVSYCCTQNVASIIKSHNKKLINTSMKNILPYNCRKKSVPQMVNVELRILFTNSLPQQMATLTKFIQILQVISNGVFTTTGCHLIMRAT